MNLMMCMRGKSEQLSFLKEITELGTGIELGSYGVIGIRPEQNWETRFAMHGTVRNLFQGTMATPYAPMGRLGYDVGKQQGVTMLENSTF